MTTNNFVPMGTVVAFALKTLPTGWLFCDGSAIDPKYSALIQQLGSSNTPNLSGRTLIGAGPAPANDTQSDGSNPHFPQGKVWSPNDTGGEYEHTLTYSEMPQHRHPLEYHFSLSGGCPGGSGSTPCQDGETQWTDNVGDSAAHNNLQPYFAIRFIIYTGN